MVEAMESEQARFWNGPGGEMWRAMRPQLTGHIAGIGAAAIARAGFRPGERVLDVGCGGGESSIEIARRVAPGGSVLAVDVSALLLPLAEADARSAGASNLRFQLADAATASFDGAPFDVIFSRFGVMFFNDPAAAFRNLASALKPGGRMTLACWRTPRENLMLSLPMRAAGSLLPAPPPPDPRAPGPFAFADPDYVREVLARSGFAAVEIEPFDWTPAGDTLDDTVALMMRMGPLAAALREAEANDELRGRAEAAVRDAFRAHERDGRVSLPAAGWIVSAKRP